MNDLVDLEAQIEAVIKGISKQLLKDVAKSAYSLILRLFSVKWKGKSGPVI